MTSNEQQVTLGYLSFIRRQRRQSLLDLTLAFEDISERRVVETTYDSSDVQGILKDLEAAVLAIVGNELQLHSHMNVLLLQQLLRQADTKGVPLKPHLASLEDKELLDRVRQFETEQFETSSKSKVKEDPEKTTILSPPSPAPPQEQGELQKENQDLRSELKILKAVANQRAKEELRVKSQFERQIAALKEELDIAKQDERARDPLELYKQKDGTTKLENELAQLKKVIQEKERAIVNLESDLASRLEHSKAVQSLRGILSRKNEVIKKFKAKHAAKHVSEAVEVSF